MTIFSIESVIQLRVIPVKSNLSYFHWEDAGTEEWSSVKWKMVFMQSLY